jgi:signal peptidase
MVIDIMENDGKLSFKTKGINNNTEDRLAVPAANLIAEYTGIRIPGAGNFAIFMQSTTGLIVCVVLPIVLFVGYDVIRRRVYEKNKGDDMAALMAELETLRSMQNAENKAQNDEEKQSD